jgi:hypothetical protein
MRIVDETGSHKNRIQVNFPHTYSPTAVKTSFAKTATYFWPPTSGNIYNRIFLKAAFPLSCSLPFDGQLNTLAPSFGPVKTINENLAFYRLHMKNKNNRGKAPWELSRFSINIKKRYREVFWARKSAKHLGLVFPKRNVLNYEVSFLSYRFFLKKLNFPYFFSYRDSWSQLMILFLRYILCSRQCIFFKSKVLVWHLLLFLGSKSFAFWLVAKRFSRDLV